MADKVEGYNVVIIIHIRAHDRYRYRTCCRIWYLISLASVPVMGTGSQATTHYLYNPFSITEVITILLENEIGIIQLPCPEMITYGVKRWGHVREQFDTPYFRNECQRIMMPIINQLKDYIKNDYKIVGVIGIDGSPSCGVNKSCFGAWGGEILGDQDIFDRINKLEFVSQPGIFMEEI